MYKSITIHMIRTFCWHFAKKFDSIYFCISLFHTNAIHIEREHKPVVCELWIVICFAAAASESLCVHLGWLNLYSQRYCCSFDFSLRKHKMHFIFGLDKSSKCNHAIRTQGIRHTYGIVIIIIISFYVSVSV